jgi:Uma2 family endonuclease
VYRADGGVSVLTIDDTLTGDELLPGFTLPLRELFAQD